MPLVGREKWTAVYPGGGVSECIDSRVWQMRVVVVESLCTPVRSVVVPLLPTAVG